MKAMELCVPAGTLSDLNITGPEFLHWMPVVQDQQTGGIIMKIVQEIVYGTIIGYVFFRWARREREKIKSSYNNCRRIYRRSKSVWVSIHFFSFTKL